MLNLDEIQNTIEELENGATTFENCRNLASLYIVDKIYRERHEKQTNAVSDDVATELGDILPQYHLYCEVKRKYQLHELTREAVVLAISDVCIEIKEFIQSLYSHTDMPEERDQLKKLVKDLGGAF